MRIFIIASFLLPYLSFAQTASTLFPSNSNQISAPAVNPVRVQRELQGLSNEQRNAVLQNEEVRRLQSEITNLKEERDTNQNLINTYRGGVDSYRLNETNAEAARRLETERALKEQAVKYEAKIQELEQNLDQTQTEYKQYISTQTQSRRIQYTGGEGLRKWSVSKPTKGKNNI